MGEPGDFGYVVVVGGLISAIEELILDYTTYLKCVAQANLPIVGVCTGACILRDPQSIDKLQDLLDEARGIRESPDADMFWDINERRHRIINSMIGNAELAKLHDLYYHKVAPFWFALASDDLARETKMLEIELDEMIVWMKSGDVKSVANIQRNHTSYGMIRAQSQLRKRGELT